MTEPRHQHAHLVWIDGDVVVLDPGAGSYACLIADRCAPDTDAAAMSQRLAAAGLPADIPAAAHQRPGAAHWRDASPPADLTLKGALHDVALSLAVAAWQFNRWPLSRLIDPRRQPPTGRGEASHVAAAVARFDRIAALVPFSPACLFRALWLRIFLARRGIATTWVFGVQLFPFRAHCWLARGDWVIGDAAHRLAAFSPILEVDPPC